MTVNATDSGEPVPLLPIPSHGRADDALERWEGEGGCVGLPAHRDARRASSTTTGR
jgi:hypothetical protein